MLINIVPKFSNLVKFKRDPYIFSLLNTKIEVQPNFSNKIPLDALYRDVYSKVNVDRNVWQLGVFNLGSGIIGGVVTENLIPIPDCFLYLYQSSTGILANRTVSDKNGNFKFTGIAADVSYFVVAVHKAKKYNAVILDEVRIDSAL